MINLTQLDILTILSALSFSIITISYLFITLQK